MNYCEYIGGFGFRLRFLHFLIFFVSLINIESGKIKEVYAIKIKYYGI